MSSHTKQSSMVEAATETIRNKILDLTLPPGKPISMRWLADTLGLGRTPSREALNRLAAEGLVHIEANQSAMVRALDLDEINQLMEALRIAERIRPCSASSRIPGCWRTSPRCRPVRWQRCATTAISRRATGMQPSAPASRQPAATGISLSSIAELPTKRAG